MAANPSTKQREGDHLLLKTERSTRKAVKGYIMRTETVEVKLYKFEELTEQAKCNAMSILSPDHDWWDFIEGDIESLGVTLHYFELGRGSKCSLRFNGSIEDVAIKVLETHGNACETYKTAKLLIEGKSTKEEFMDDLQEDYRILLEKEYEYLCSEEYIQELCDCNDYEFTVGGELY